MKKVCNKSCIINPSICDCKYDTVHKVDQYLSKCTKTAVDNQKNIITTNISSNYKNIYYLPL